LRARRASRGIRSLAVQGDRRPIAAEDRGSSLGDEEIRRRSLAIHGDERAHEFFVRERWNIYEYPDPADKPSTLPEQLRWMEEVGFEEVDVSGPRPATPFSVATKP